MAPQHYWAPKMESFSMISASSKILQRLTTIRVTNSYDTTAVFCRRSCFMLIRMSNTENNDYLNEEYIQRFYYCISLHSFIIECKWNKLWALILTHIVNSVTYQWQPSTSVNLSSNQAIMNISKTQFRDQCWSTKWDNSDGHAHFLSKLAPKIK